MPEEYNNRSLKPTAVTVLKTCTIEDDIDNLIYNSAKLATLLSSPYKFDNLCMQ